MGSVVNQKTCKELEFELHLSRNGKKASLEDLERHPCIRPFLSVLQELFKGKRFVRLFGSSLSFRFHLLK